MLFIYNWNWLKISQWRKKNIDWLSKFEKKSTNWHFLISGWLFGKILLSCKLHKPCDHSDQIYSTSVRSNEKYKDVALQNCSSKNSSSHFEVIFSIRAYVRARAIIYKSLVRCRSQSKIVEPKLLPKKERIVRSSILMVRK